MAEFAEPFVSLILERITTLMIEEGKFLHGVRDQALQLQSELKLMQALLKDADARQDEAAVIREWISQSKDLAYEIENSLETFAFKVASRRRRGVVNALKRYTCILNECFLRHKVGLEIQSLNSRVSNLTKRFQEFGIRTIMEREEGSSSRQQQQLMIRRTCSHVEEEDFVGLESDVKILAEHLVNENDQVTHEYSIVSICGMGGLGKTTIARKVYNHPNVRRHFNCFAWICISQQWQTREILQGILLKIIPEKREEIMKNWTDDELVGQLYRVQQNTKCLVVLDDIWSTSAWECMKSAFPIGGRGSKILLTTRNKNVAVLIGPNGFHHEPRLLSQDESWVLLEKKALRGQYNHGHGHEDVDKLRVLGKEMVKYCGGLPLAIVVLGGILATKHEFNEWKFVFQNVKPYFGKGEIIGQEEGLQVQRILGLSYTDLPYRLKPCFLYLAIYPEDHDIEVESLYQLWMAEGMVSKEDRIGEESMMDVAERYLVEFAKRCMLQVELKKEPSIRKIESCRLHDLMRDLCLAKAKDENFLSVIDYRHRHIDTDIVDSSSSTGNVQRLVIFLNEEDVSKYVPPKKEMIGHVRSFIFSRLGGGLYEGYLARTQFNSFKMLRALTIEGLNPAADTFYDSLCSTLDLFKLQVGELSHLRYLCLRNSSFLCLPSSVGNLEYLETLDLHDCEILWIRDVLWKLKRLRHLCLPSITSPIQGICGKLRFVGLTKLEILENFDTRHCESKDLSKLGNLQVLKVAAYEENDCAKIIDYISNSTHLKHVQLEIEHFPKSEMWSSVLEKLFSSKLYYLNLIGELSMFPEYRAHYFHYLIELVLERTNISADPMETLEKLPNLQKLWLKEDAFVGREMTCRRMGFPQLKFLSLYGLGNLIEWKVEEEAMTKLSRLEIENCWELQRIPDGLRKLQHSKELVIVRSPNFP
ncbi:hypothetical protein ACH5RR_031711 [Cinchona calisaya]|uniref:Disease resistance protein At1g50180 n=1 Tax=Cinchona calisaya TaxID=153742 RepID=A0ABD2YIU3_9GENT